MVGKSLASVILAKAGTTASGALSLMSGLLAGSLMLYSSYVIYDTAYAQQNAGSTWELLQYRPEIIDDGAVPLAGADTLAKINKDYRAWLTMYDTNIDYPVLQGENDLYYASHDVHGKNSLTGSIYLAAGSTADWTDGYNLVYGHHMDNSIMFGALDKYLDPDFFNAHREGVIVSKDSVYDLYTFAVLKTDAYESQVYTVGPSRTVQDMLNFLSANVNGTGVNQTVIYDAAAAEGIGKIVAFSTCADATTSGRLVVFARMVKRVPDSPSYTGGGGGGGGGTGISGTIYNPGGNPGIASSDSRTDGVDTADAALPQGVMNASRDLGEGDQTNEPIPVEATDTIEEIGDTTEEIGDTETPLAQFINSFKPGGNTHGERAWALVNLICVAVTAYILVPLMHIRDKYGRSKMMKKINKAKEELRVAKELAAQEKLERARIEEIAKEQRQRIATEEGYDPSDTEVSMGSLDPNAEVSEDEFADAVEIFYYQLKKFLRRFRLGVSLEALDLILAVIAFILTEDMRLPMVLIDKWTPLMLVLLAIAWVIDFRLARYRSKVLAEEEQQIREEAASVNAGA